MSTALYICLSFVVALLELAIIYNLIFLFMRMIFFLISAIIKRRFLGTSQPFIFGLLAGIIATFFILLSMTSIFRYAGIDTSWACVIVIVAIFYGEVQYLEKNLKSVQTGVTPSIGWPGRLNAAISSPIMRGEFEYNKTVLSQTFHDQVGIEGDPIGHESYRKSMKYMMKVSSLTLVGIVIGVVLFVLYRMNQVH